MRLIEDGEIRLPGETNIASIPICSLEEIGELGPDSRDVMDGFERTDSITPYPIVANHDTNKRRRIKTEPDQYLAPLVTARPGRRLKTVEQLWPKGRASSDRSPDLAQHQ